MYPDESRHSLTPRCGLAGGPLPLCQTTEESRGTSSMAVLVNEQGVVQSNGVAAPPRPSPRPSVQGGPEGDSRASPTFVHTGILLQPAKINFTLKKRIEPFLHQNYIPPQTQEKIMDLFFFPSCFPELFV